METGSHSSENATRMNMLSPDNPYQSELNKLKILATDKINMADADYLQGLMRIRDNFVEKNKDSILIKHSETLKYSEGRRIRTRNIHRDRSLQKTRMESDLHIHREHISSIGNASASPTSKMKRHKSPETSTLHNGTLPFKHRKVSDKVPKPGDATCEI